MSTRPANSSRKERCSCVDRHARYTTRLSVKNKEYKTIYLFGNVVCLSEQLTGQNIAMKRQTVKHSLSFSGGHVLQSPADCLADFIASTHAHNASTHKNFSCARNLTNAKHPNHPLNTISNSSCWKKSLFITCSPSYVYERSIWDMRTSLAELLAEYIYVYT